MKSLPAVFALLVIGMTSFAVANRTAPSEQIPKTSLDEVLPPVPQEPVDISIDDLALPIKSRNDYKESVIPKHTWELNGKRVRMIGTMFPPLQDKGIEEFTFVGDSQLVSFHAHTPFELVPVQCTIQAILPEGETTVFFQGTTQVEGTLVIKPKFSTGGLYQLYHLEEATIQLGKQKPGFHSSFGVPCPNY